MKNLALLAVFLALPLALFAQTVNAPQEQVNLSFLTGGPYGQSSALDVTFGYQFTTNNTLQGHFITMPGPSYTGYVGGNAYNLCGVSAVENALATTSLSCGKFSYGVEADGGLGRIASVAGTTEQGPAFLASLNIGYDPTGAGKTALLLKGGWGHFGPTVPATPATASLSGNGFFFYSGINFGMGSNAAASQAKLAHIQKAQAKKLKKLQQAAAKASRS